MPRMRQIRSVILERREDDKRRDVSYLTAAVRQITSVQASSAQAKSKDLKQIDAFDLWDGEPETPQRKQQLPSTGKVTAMFGGGRELISWDEVQRLAAERKAG